MANGTHGFDDWHIPLDGTISRAQYDVLVAHPRFPAAARQLSRSMLDLAAADPALDGIVKDAGRFLATGLAIYLHATGGLTLARLKELGARDRVISPGRARAILIYLRFLHYVVPAPDGGRAARFVPTPELERAYHAILCGGIDAAAVIEPRLERLSNRLADPRVAADLARISGRIGLSHSSNTDSSAIWRVFLNRHAGTQILHALMLAAEDDKHYPPQGEIAFSLTGLARDFRVSRPHVARLLRGAEQEGLIALRPDSRLAFTPAGLLAARDVLGARLATALRTAISLMHELDAAPLPAAASGP
jgi:hypothetical protein